MASTRTAQVAHLSILLAVLSTFALALALPAIAQDGDTDEEITTDEPRDTQKTQNHIIISIGALHQRVEGNPQRFRQYVTPVNGWTATRLQAVHPLDEHGRTFGLTITDILEPPAGFVGHLYDIDLGLRFDTRYRRSEFFDGFYAGDPELRRRDWDTDVRWRIGPNDHLMAGYSTLSMRGVGAGQDWNWRATRWGASYTRNFGAYNGILGFGQDEFNFLVPGPYLSGSTDTISLGVNPARDGRTLFSGSAVFSDTSLVGTTGSPEETTISLSGFRQVTDDLTVHGDLRLWELDGSIANNAYAQSEHMASIEAEYSGLWRTSLRGGFETADLDYVNGKQTQIVEPAVNTSYASLRSRPRRDVKVQLDFKRRRVDDRPLAYNIAGIPVTTRIWEEADMFRARGTYTPSWAPVGLTAGYREDQRENTDQGTSTKAMTKDLTAWWEINEDVTATASLFEQDFSLWGAGPAGSYISESEAWQLGASWRVSDQTSLAADYARTDAFGAIELRQETVSASLEHRWDTHKVRLGVVLDDLDDYNGTLLGYDADMWFAEFSTVLP